MSNDARISQYRDAIDAKRKALGEKPRLAYTTNALLELDGTKINLNTLSSEEQCVGIVARLLALTHQTNSANELLGTSVVLKFGDFTTSQWVSDIKLRVDLLKYERQKKKLAQMDDQLKTLMSDDAKTADAIAGIAAQLEG